MTTSSIQILIGGEAGQGLVTIGQLMSKALVRSGYHILVSQDYMSRVRGGHNTFAIRTGPEEILGTTESIDILVALNQDAIDLHKDLLTDNHIVVAAKELDCAGLNVLAVPFKDLASRKLLYNTVALGVLQAAICHEEGVLEELLRQTFAKKGDAVIEENLEVLRKSAAWANDQQFAFTCMPPAAKGEPRMMMNGNEAIAMGALAAGCNFLSFYPMTPSTSVALTLIAKGGPLGLVAEQVEDEIGVMNMAIGASYAGAKAIVTTSGGGFALMGEGVSLAGITETPVVTILVQRPGPATGLPTRTEQGDLNLVLHSGHGEFPRAVFAPGDVDECFHLTHRAFDMAEKYQTPVFVLSDQYLADSYRAIVPFDLDLPEVARPLEETDADYLRYKVTSDGISPRGVPGFGLGLVKADSDEHDEHGHIVEDAPTRIAQQNKRMAKGAGLLNETVPPAYFGPDDPDLLMVCCGSSMGPCLEAMETLDNAAVLHFSQVWPLKEDQFMDLLESAKSVVGVEGNGTGQFAKLLAQETGFRIQDMILRFDGRPLTAGYILKGLEDIR